MTAAEHAPGFEELHEWRLLGGREKAASVLELTSGLKIESVLEIGCGTGAVLEILDRAAFGTRYDAVEPDPALVRFVGERGAISRLASLRTGTVNAVAPDGVYDLVLLSHVLEHVKAPGDLLAEALGRGRLVVAEVPLEGTPLGRLRARLKEAATGRDRRENPTGHIHFFSPRSFEALVASAGGVILRRRLYVPRDVMRHAVGTGRPLRRAYARIVWALSRLAGEKAWVRLYYGHYAVLVRNAGR